MTRRRSNFPVLVADDDPTVLRLFTTALAQAGFATREASDADSALAVAGTESLAAVVLDVHMPGTSGIDVIRRLRERPGTSTLPVILVTGDQDLEGRVEGLRAGANDHVTKPVDPTELVARVEAQCRASDAWSEAADVARRARDSVVKALSRLEFHGPVEQTAREVCQTLGGLPGVEEVAVFEMLADGSAAPLEVWRETGSSESSLFRIPGERTIALADQARRGPWIHRFDEAASSASSSGSVSGVLAGVFETPVVALAPITTPDGTTGVLGLGVPRVHPGMSTDPAALALAAAIDAAPIVGSLLGLGAPERERPERAQIERAIAERAFHPVFQPVVHLDSGEVVGYEALTRFRAGSSPAEMFGHAARYGFRLQLEQVTLEAALAAASALPEERWLSLNVSPAFLCSGSLRRLLSGLDRRVVLEVTEHDPVDDYPMLRRACEALGPAVELSIDDVGAGYASLRHVLALPPGWVKLDRSWVTGIESDANRRELVAGLLAFAQRTGRKLVAEGIETSAELDVLVDLGVPYGQGWHLGVPEPVARGEQVLT